MSVAIDFDKIVDSVFSGFKKLTPALFTISLASGCVLFLPARILSQLGLDNLQGKTRSIIGIIFLASTILILVIIFSCIINRLRVADRERKLIKQYTKMYKHLPRDMKKIINEMMCSDEKSIILDETSGNTQYLINNGFIHRPKQYVPIGRNYEFRVKYVPMPWLIELFIEKPRLFH